MNMNSGYTGFSMSNRAVRAYEEGEKPLSKWSKGELIEILQDFFSDEEVEKIKKYSTEVLKTVFLYNSSWHHTSRYCNKTEFYQVKDEMLDKNIDYIITLLEKVKDVIRKEKEEKKAEQEKAKQNMQLVKFEYLQWSGTRRHPKATKIVDYGIKIDRWIYYRNGKKNFLTNGVEILETYSRAPKGTAKIFNKLRKVVK